MRTTVALDDELLATAAKWSGIGNKSELLNFVLREFIQREAARRLAEMGGSMPDLELTPRSERAGREPVSYAGKSLNEIPGMRVAEP